MPSLLLNLAMKGVPEEGAFQGGSPRRKRRRGARRGEEEEEG